MNNINCYIFAWFSYMAVRELCHVLPLNMALLVHMFPAVKATTTVQIIYPWSFMQLTSEKRPALRGLAAGLPETVTSDRITVGCIISCIVSGDAISSNITIFTCVVFYPPRWNGNIDLVNNN